MRKKSFFADIFKDRLEKAISELEKKTTVEIVPVFESSKNYFLKHPLLFFWPPCFLPSFLRAKSVSERARNIFIRLELCKTKNRNALMIFISQVDKSVYLLADEMLEKKIPVTEWQSIAQRLAHDFNSDNPGDSFFEALKAVEPRIIELFPNDESNANELSDRLVE
jgi:uncharacterized membrane protein